jgi:pentatricopeptide repeat protein
VLSLYEEALQSNAQLDGGIYSLAMLAALNCGLYQQVPRIAEKARSEGVPLTEASYTILIQALGEAGGADQAVDCLDTMISEGLKPNVNYRL